MRVPIYLNKNVVALITVYRRPDDSSTLLLDILPYSIATEVKEPND